MALKSFLKHSVHESLRVQEKKFGYNSQRPYRWFFEYFITQIYHSKSYDSKQKTCINIFFFATHGVKKLLKFVFLKKKKVRSLFFGFQILKNVLLKKTQKNDCKLWRKFESDIMTKQVYNFYNTVIQEVPNKLPPPLPPKNFF